MSVFPRSKIHIPTYAGLFNNSDSFILCTATKFSLNILLLAKVGFHVNLINFFLICD